MISIVITARERYGLTSPSVLSILKEVNASTQVIYVAGKAPAAVLTFLEKTTRTRKNFTLLREDRYLYPNEARNLALARVPRKNDVVFIENDLLVRKGCLKHLLNCARREGADIVAPLIFEGDFADSDPLCHDAGANLLWRGSDKTGPVVRMEHFWPHTRVDWKVLSPQRVHVVESHCFFVRRKLLDRVVLKKNHGGLFAHLDLGLQAERLGAKVMVEPKAQALFANPYLSPLQTRSDFDFFIFQWSEKENRDRFREIARDWGIHPWGRILRDYREWMLWNKGMVFKTFGVLTGLERLLWRMARMFFFPGWARQWVEWFLTARIRAGAWKDGRD